MLMVWSMTWLLVRTRPPDVMIIPVPATSPFLLAVSALISTTDCSIFATVALEIVPPLPELDPVPGLSPVLLGASPVPAVPSDAVAGCVMEASVSAHAVPPPAPTHRIANPARSRRRIPGERDSLKVAGGHGGGPHP